MQRLKVKNVQPVVVTQSKHWRTRNGNFAVKPQPSRKYIHCPKIADVPIAYGCGATTNNLLHTAYANSKDNCIGIKDFITTDNPVARPVLSRVKSLTVGG